jgi:hypothetical protein
VTVAAFPNPLAAATGGLPSVHAVAGWLTLILASILCAVNRQRVQGE